MMPILASARGMNCFWKYACGVGIPGGSFPSGRHHYRRGTAIRAIVAPALRRPAHLEHAHGVVEAAQRHLAAVAEHEPLALGELPYHVRGQYLAALGHGGDAGRPDDGRAEQVPAPVRVVLRDGLPRVQANAHADSLTR